MLYVTVYAQLVLLQAVARLECEFALGARVRSHPSVVHEVPANNLLLQDKKGHSNFPFLELAKCLKCCHNSGLLDVRRTAIASVGEC